MKPKLSIFFTVESENTLSMTKKKKGCYRFDSVIFDFTVKDNKYVWGLVPYTVIENSCHLTNILTEMTLVKEVNDTGDLFKMPNDINYQKNDLIIWDKFTGLSQIVQDLDQDISLLFKDMSKKNIGFLKIKKGKPFYRFRDNHSGEYIMLSKKDKKRMITKLKINKED